MEGFTRQEAAVLSGAKPSDLSYWDRIGFLCPVKIGNPKKPECIYSVQQILQAAITIKLKSAYPPADSRKIANLIATHPNVLEMLEKELLWINDELVIGRSDTVGQAVLEMLRQSPGVVITRFPTSFDGLLSKIRANAVEYRVLDFDKRVVGTVLEQKRVLAA